MKLAVVGATGLVGSKMLEILAERKFPVTELVPVASERSVGKEIVFDGKKIKVLGMEEAVSLRPDIALFSAGGNTSLEWAPKFADQGTVVVDNSSAWRMDPSKKLVVPEINANVIDRNDRIIANPNCSTIQMVLALHPLQKRYGIKRIVVSTYQSVTGTGKLAVDQLMDERNATAGAKVYPYQIDLNIIPQIDVFLENGYTKEEMKMVNETRKILGDSSICITATAVRIPVIGGHSESINVELDREFTEEEVIDLLRNAPGIKLLNDNGKQLYPMPITAHNKDDVFVGRVRRDESQPKTLNLWVVSDNLRKGAATNAVQIAEYLLNSGLVTA